MNIVNGFFPFEVVDTDKDNLISFDEFVNALHPIEHSPLYNTGNLVLNKVYENKVGDAAKRSWFATLWWLVVDSLEDKITKEQYDKVISEVHTIGNFDTNNDFVILDSNHPRAAYAKSEYSKIKVSI